MDNYERFPRNFTNSRLCLNEIRQISKARSYWSLSASMRPTTIAFRTTIILIIVMVAQSLSIAEVQGSLITKLIRISGLRGQLDHLTAALLMTVPDDLFPDNRSRSNFNAHMKEQINTESLVKVFEETFSENVDTDKLDKAIKFYESSVGRKVGRIQGDSLSAYNIKAVREARRMITALTEDRTQLLERLIDNQRVYQNNVAFRKLIVRLLGSPGWNEHSKSQDDSGAGLDSPKTSSENEPDSLHQTALTCFAYTYRSLTDPELESLAKFQKTEAGPWFENTVSRGFEQIIRRTVKALDHGLRNLKDRSTKN